jgi:hypothetical protein
MWNLIQEYREMTNIHTVTYTCSHTKSPLKPLLYIETCKEIVFSCLSFAINSIVSGNGFASPIFNEFSMALALVLPSYTMGRASAPMHARRNADASQGIDKICAVQR